MANALATMAADLVALRRDAARYRYLRERPADMIGKGGVFAGMTQAGGESGYILTQEHLDRAVDEAITKEGGNG